MADIAQNIMTQSIPVISPDVFSDLTEVAVEAAPGGVFKTPGFFDDLSKIRVDGVDTGMSVTEVIATIPVRKPSSNEFFRISTDPKMTLTTTLYSDKQNRGEWYFVSPALRPMLFGELKLVTLRVGITRQMAPFVWPIGISPDGRPMGWYDSARRAAVEAETTWTRITADMALGAYRIYKAEGSISDPEWPDLSMNAILDIAFKDRIIDTEDHSIIRSLRGL